MEYSQVAKGLADPPQREGFPARIPRPPTRHPIEASMRPSIAPLAATALTAALLASGPLANAASPPGGLRSRQETLYFSCQSIGQDWIALCGGSDGQLRYRFGKPGRIVFRYPASDSPPAIFRYAHYFRAQAERTEVSFSNGGADYALFDYTEGRQRSAGVRAVAQNGREKVFPCLGAMQLRLHTLADVLPCDADNALTLGACPDPSHRSAREP